MDNNCKSNTYVYSWNHTKHMMDAKAGGTDSLARRLDI
jgi:hypothetical protein